MKRTLTYKSAIPYEVHLSIDMDVQNCAQNFADRALENAKDSRVSNISVLAIDVQTGRILAWVGSNSFFDEENSMPFQSTLPYCRSRVVPAVGSVMAVRVWVRRLKSVDLPTLGRPTMATSFPIMVYWFGRGC